MARAAQGVILASEEVFNGIRAEGLGRGLSETRHRDAHGNLARREIVGQRGRGSGPGRGSAREVGGRRVQQIASGWASRPRREAWSPWQATAVLRRAQTAVGEGPT